jgi:hypothetical protein
MVAGVHQLASVRSAFGRLSGTSGRSPFWVPFPVLQSFKEQGNRLSSSEVAGPYEVFVLVPIQAPAGFPTGPSGVSDRPPDLGFDPDMKAIFGYRERLSPRSILHL